MLDIPKIYSDPIISRKRLGNEIQPFKKIKESLTVEKHYVILTEIPNDYNKVKVTGLGKEFYEIEEGFLSENTYKVDYINGIVYFHESLKNRTLNFEYTGEGVLLYPDSRVYLTGDKNFPNVRDKFFDVDRAILVQKNRVDELIRSTPQPSEVVDMRVDYNGKIFPVAKDRIDAEQRKIEEAFVDAKGKRHESLKLRIDSLELATEKRLDDLTGETINLQSQIDIIPGRITAKVQELRESVDGEFDYAYSLLDMLSDEMTLKVDVNGVISSINLSEEGVRIDGKNIWLTGDSKIDNAIIDSAHIKSLDADKINVGVLEGHTLKGGYIEGGEIRQILSDRELIMRDGELFSFHNNDLAMKFGQYSLEFYNRSNDKLGEIVPLKNEDDDRETHRGLGVVVEHDFINIGVRRDGLIRPVFRASFEDNVTTVSGPYNGALPGSSLRLFANRRAISEERFSSFDQPAIILDQGEDSNNTTIYFGGLNRRNDAEFRVRWRNRTDGYTNRITASSEGVYLGGRVIGSSSSTGNILGSEGNAYYENNTGSNTLSRTDSLRAGGLRTRTGLTHLYLGTLGGGEVRVTNGNGQNAGEGVIYRDIRASNFINTSSKKYKTNIKSFSDNALDHINKLKIVKYKLKDEVKRLGEGAKEMVGFIAEDSPSISTEDGEAIDLYKVSSLNTKSIQELSQFNNKLLNKINNLEKELVKLKKQLKN